MNVHQLWGASVEALDLEVQQFLDARETDDVLALSVVPYGEGSGYVAFVITSRERS